MIRLGNENNSGAWASRSNRNILRNKVATTAINPGGPILFLRSACTQRIAAPASINEWPGKLIGIKACARADRDNVPVASLPPREQFDDQGYCRQSGAPDRARSGPRFCYHHCQDF